MPATAVVTFRQIIMKSSGVYFLFLLQRPLTDRAFMSDSTQLHNISVKWLYWLSVWFPDIFLKRRQVDEDK